MSACELFEVALVRARPRSATRLPVRACPHSERLNSTTERPREPARILGAEAAFVRARSHSGRRGQTFLFFQCTSSVRQCTFQCTSQCTLGFLYKFPQ